MSWLDNAMKDGFSVNPLEEDYKKDVENYTRAVQAIKYFQLEFDQDVLLNEIKRIGKYEDFFNIENPNDFFYKIDISKAENIPLKSIACAAILTLNTHTNILNYYKRLITEDNIPALQNYVAPATKSDSANGERTMYYYTTHSIFRLYMFLYLKNEHKYTNTAILSLLGYGFNSSTVIDTKKEGKRGATATHKNDNKAIAELQTIILKNATTTANMMNVMQQAIVEMDAAHFEDTHKREMEHVHLQLNHVQEKMSTLNNLIQSENARKATLSSEIEALTNKQEQLTQEFQLMKSKEVDLKIDLQHKEDQHANLQQEEENEKENHDKQLEKIQSTPVQKASFIQRLFGATSPIEAQPYVIEVKDFSTAKNAIKEQIETIRKSLATIEHTLAVNEALQASIKGDLAEKNKLLIDSARVLEGYQAELLELSKRQGAIDANISTLTKQKHTLRPALAEALKLLHNEQEQQQQFMRNLLETASSREERDAPVTIIEASTSPN